MRSGWNLLVTPRTYAAALERRARDAPFEDATLVDASGFVWALPMNGVERRPRRTRPQDVEERNA
jgi:hypothetical protein